MPRIALLNVKYSPNLGDGIIAECLEHELASIRPDWKIHSIDLAARDAFGTGLDYNREKVLKILNAVPPVFRRIATASALFALIELKYRGFWKKELQGIDAAIVGGGQLFADADLNFPLKINAVASEVGQIGAPLAVFGVGVAQKLTSIARNLFSNALGSTSIAHVAVRDSSSRSNWKHHFANSEWSEARLCHDPGLLASNAYGAAARSDKPRNPPQVGIGIVNPRTLNLHSSNQSKLTMESARKFWCELASKLTASGYGVTLFTNGPHDDEGFLETTYAQLANQGVLRAPRPQTPRDLADIIKSFDVIAAHRLHASILAYAFCIPHVGFSWDPKLNAFYETVGRSQFISDPTQSEVGQVEKLIAQALDEGIDKATHATVVENTRDAIRMCAMDLENSIRQV